MLVEYQLTIRNAADSADALVVSSVRGGTNPYLSSVPSGDGASFDPLTGVVIAGAFSGRLVDPITSGTSRLFTSILEDADGRQQLGHRKAFWKFREDGGAWTVLYAGRLTRYELVSDIEWEIVIGDWMKAEHEFKVFDTHAGESFSAYLTRWPNRGCILGGPILGGFLGVKDFGGWEFRVGHLDTINNFTRLDFVRGYDARGRRISSNEQLEVAKRTINEAARPFWVHMPGTWIIEEAFGPVDMPFGTWPDLAAIVDDAIYTPINAFFEAGGGSVSGPADLLASGNSGRASLIVRGVAGGLGDTVHVDVISRRASEVSPIYWTGHPVDLLAALWDEAGIPYSASALEDVRDRLGSNLQQKFRITAPALLGTFLEAAIYGPLGIAARGNDAAEIEAFVSRIFIDVVPSLTISEVDVVLGETQPFALNTDSAIRTLLFEHERLISATFDSLDTITVHPERFERSADDEDAGALGTGEQSYRVPGEMHVLDATKFDLRGWVDGRALEIFDRWGRGIRSMATLLRRGGGGDDVKLGDEILVDLPQIPNANKRLGDDAAISARSMQITHLTPTLQGKYVRLLDAGPNANQLSTRPTLTIAASASAPRNVAEVVVTNAAALNALEYRVRIQQARTTGGAPAAEDYTDVDFYRAGQIPTTEIGLSPVLADTTIYVRARSERVDARPSNWSDVESVALDAFDPPTNLVATPDAVDASQCLLEWDVGTDSASTLIEVYLRLSSESADEAKLVDILPAGSIHFTLDELVDDEEYIASVNHYNEATGERSARDDVTFTAGSTVAALAVPVLPDSFSFPFRSVPVGTRHQLGDYNAAKYGIVVKATEFPSEVEIAEALEDSPGAGTYGSFETVGRMPSVARDWTLWAAIAPNDGLLRKLKARHVRQGTTSSSYTSEVIADPSVFNPIEPYPTGPSMDIVAVPGATSYTINYTVDADTFEYSIDGGAYAAVPATGFTVSRNAINGADKTLTFRAVKDGQTITLEVPIPAQGIAAVSLSIGPCVADTGAGELEVPWTATGMPTGTTFNVGYDNGDGNVDSTTGIASSPHTFTGVTFNGAPGAGAVFVDAIHDGKVIASAKRNKPYVT